MAGATGPALDRAVDDLVIVGGADPAGEALSIEQVGEFHIVTLDLRQAAIRLVGADLADEQVAEAGLAAVRLQIDRPAGKDGDRAVVVVLHDDVVDVLLIVELDRDVRADHGDVHAIPLAGAMIGAGGGKSLVGFVVPKSAGALRRTVLGRDLAPGIPNLHLRNSAEIDAAVAVGIDLPIDPELEVSVFLGGGEEGLLAVADDFAAAVLIVIDAPMGGG